MREELLRILALAVRRARLTSGRYGLSVEQARIILRYFDNDIISTSDASRLFGLRPQEWQTAIEEVVISLRDERFLRRALERVLRGQGTVFESSPVDVSVRDNIAQGTLGLSDRLGDSLELGMEEVAVGDDEFSSFQTSALSDITEAYVDQAILGHATTDLSGAVLTRLEEDIRTEAAFLDNFGVDIVAMGLGGLVALSAIDLDDEETQQEFSNTVRKIIAFGAGAVTAGTVLFLFNRHLSARIRQYGGAAREEAYSGMYARLRADDPQSVYIVRYISQDDPAVCDLCDRNVSNGAVSGRYGGGLYPLGQAPVPGRDCFAGDRCRCLQEAFIITAEEFFDIFGERPR